MEDDDEGWRTNVLSPAYKVMDILEQMKHLMNSRSHTSVSFLPVKL